MMDSAKDVVNKSRTTEMMKRPGHGDKGPTNLGLFLAYTSLDLFE